MLKTVFVTMIILLLTIWATAFSQSSGPSKDSRSLEWKPTIYLDLDCQNQAAVRLRLHNNTSWAITIPTFSFYFNPKKQATVKLNNGNTVFALPNDMDISSTYFHVEKDYPQNTVRVPVLKYSDSFDQSWIAPKDSILFSVPKEYLREGLQIYVRFNYEWELNKQGIISSGEPEHKVIYRGITFLNLDAPPACRD